jgi:hypothetical protein
MTDLPGYSGDLNLFSIERAEDGENRAFFHFVRDDCRLKSRSANRSGATANGSRFRRPRLRKPFRYCGPN